MALHPKTIKIESFKGLNNILTAEGTEQEYLKTANNIDLDKRGGISVRKGYSLINSADYHSLWANDAGTLCYVVKDGNLVRVVKSGSTYSFTNIVSSIGSSKVAYEEVDGVVYYSNGIVSGVLEEDTSRSWGLAKVQTGPVLTAITGTLFSGTYQVSLTAIDSRGFESGVSVSSILAITSGGIQLNLPPANDPRIVFYKVYCSTADGNTLYYHGLSAPSSVYNITSISSSISPLRVFGLDAPPKGHLIRYYNGRVYVAVDNILYYTEKYQYEYVNLSSNYIEYPSRIRAIMPVDDGIWIASNALYYLSGSEPEAFKNSLKEHITIVEGTDTKISGSYVHLDNTPIGYKWLVTSDLGIFILFNQGMTINMTSQNVSLEQADLGTSVFLQHDGMNQYLSILNTNNNPNNAVVGDLVEATIVRNGVTI